MPYRTGTLTKSRVNVVLVTRLFLTGRADNGLRAIVCLEAVLVMSVLVR